MNAPGVEEIKPDLAITVARVMTTDVVFCERGETLDAALGIMARHDIRHVPIVDGLGSLIGIVSDRDVTRTELKGELGKTVGDVMSDDVVTVGPDDTIATAMDLMILRRIGALCVTSDQRLVGIVSYIDIMIALRGAPKPVD